MTIGQAILDGNRRLQDRWLAFTRQYGNLLLRWAIVAGVLGASLAFGVLVAKSTTRTVLMYLVAAAAAAPIALLGLRLLVQYRHFSPFMILAAAILVKYGVPVRGSSYVVSLLLTMAFAVEWLLRSVTREGRFVLVPSPVNRPALIWMGLVVISLVWSNLYRDVLVVVWSSFPLAQISSSLVMIMLPVTTLLVTNYFDDMGRLQGLVWIMLGTAVLGLFNEFFFELWWVQTRGTYAMWIVGFSGSLLLFHRHLSMKLRVFLVLLTIGWLYWSFGLRITWLASWLPILVAGVVLLFRRSKLMLVGAIVAAVVWVVVNMSFIESVFAAENEESGHTRQAAWAQNWIVTSEHLLFGTGPAGYAVYYMTYFPRNAMATHNNYLDILSQTGITGTLAYLAIFGIALWRSYQVCRRVQGWGGWEESLANAFFAGMVAVIVIMAFGDWVVPFAYTQGIAGYDYAAFNWIFMGAMLVLDRITARQAATRSVVMRG